MVKIIAMPMFLASLFMLVAPRDALALSGNEWKQGSPSSRSAYISGVADTWQILAVIEKMNKETSQHPSAALFTDLTICMGKGMTYGQVSAIVEKYMEDNPSEWHHAMAWLAWRAVNRACSPLAR